MRREARRHPHDQQLTDLIAELRNTDADVARWWDDFTVRDYTSLSKHIEHPTAGPLSFDIEIVSASTSPTSTWSLPLHPNYRPQTCSR